MDMKPAKAPYKPSYGEILVKAKNSPVYIPDEKWATYLGWPPHLVHVRENLRHIDNPSEL